MCVANVGAQVREKEFRPLIIRKPLGIPLGLIQVAWILAGPATLVGQTGAAKGASNSPKPKVECSAMAGRTIPAGKIGLPTKGVTITNAKVQPASGTGADLVPEFCDIVGVIAPI